jgi:hypothetical protein
MQSLELIALSYRALALLSLHTVAYTFNALDAMLLAFILPANAGRNHVCPVCDLRRLS